SFLSCPNADRHLPENAPPEFFRDLFTHPFEEAVSAIASRPNENELPASALSGAGYAPRKLAQMLLMTNYIFPY
ncbi:MAG: hypothetical protein D6765_09915, partial [Bacteroidetes bacterium]